LRRRFVLVLLLVLLLVNWAAGQSSWVVTPNSGVGAITVGMTSGAAEAILTPSRVIGPAKSPVLVEYGKELFVEYQGNHAVMVSLHSNTFSTRNGPVKWVPYKGAAIGTPFSSVVGQLSGRKLSRNLPTAKSQPPESYHAYPDLGIGFRVKGGAISQIDVWKVNS